MKKRIFALILVATSAVALCVGCKKAEEETLEDVTAVEDANVVNEEETSEQEEEEILISTPSEDDLDGKAVIREMRYDKNNEPIVLVSIHKRDFFDADVVDSAEVGDTIYTDDGVPYFYYGYKKARGGYTIICAERAYEGSLYNPQITPEFILNESPDGLIYEISGSSDIPEYQERSTEYWLAMREDAVLITMSYETYEDVEESLEQALAEYDYSEYGWGSQGAINLDETGKVVSYRAWMYL